MLQVTFHPIKFIGASYPLTAAQAVLLVQSGVYEGKARQGRVYYIREVDNRLPIVSQPEYWKDRAVIKYWDNQSYRDQFPLRLGKNLWQPVIP
jgi:hypothetical protein